MTVLAQVKTWNTVEMRERMREASRRVLNSRLESSTSQMEAHKAWQDYHEEYDQITLLALPHLEILSWQESEALYEAMYPTGIYQDEHKHQHETCGCFDICPWPQRGEVCQAYEHWDKRCLKHHQIWWETYGKKENEAWLAANPPKWIHDHEENEPCAALKCRNYGKPFGSSWNSVKQKFEEATDV